MRHRTTPTIAFLLIVAACSAEGGGVTTPPVSSTTTAVEITSTVPDDPTGWDPDLAARLVELEQGSDGDWTVESAVDAMELLLPVLQAGVDEYPPIDVTRLNYFLDEHAGDLTDEQLSRLSARAPTFRVIGLAEDAVEAERAAFELAAVSAADDFASRTGYTMPGEIVVVYSQYGMLPGGLSGGARSVESAADFDWRRWSGFFSTEAEYLRAKELVEEANADGDTVCVIVIGERFRNRAPRDRNSAIYHEVVHCHQHAIHPGGIRAFMAAPSPWMDEGYATWAGELIAGGTVVSRVPWNRYHDGVGPIGGHNTVAGDYDGIVVFSYLHDNGIDGWSNFVSWFRDVRGGIGSESAKFTAIWTPLPTEVQTVWAATSLQRSSWSDVWTYTSGPGIGFSTVTRTPRPTPLFLDSDTRFALAPGEQGTYAIEPRLSGAEAALLQVSLPDGGVIRWPWGADQISDAALDVTWCLGDECVCDDGREVGPPAPEFTESGFVTVALTGGTFAVSLSTPDDPCDEEEPTPGTGPCPGGIWTADPQATEDLMVSLYRELGIADPTYEGGPITMSFFDDGSFRFDYVETTFTETIEGFAARFVLNGGSFGTWEADATTLTVVIEGQDIQLQLFLDGNLAMTSTPPGGTGGGSVPYDCDGNEVLAIDPTFEQRFWPYPRKWTRVDS